MIRLGELSARDYSQPVAPGLAGERFLEPARHVRALPRQREGPAGRASAIDLLPSQPIMIKTGYRSR